MTMIMPNKSLIEKVGIATLTFYKPGSGFEEREGFARETIRRAREEGYDVVIVDAGSHLELLRYFKDLGAILINQTSGMGDGFRTAISEIQGLGKEFTAWMEAEKCNYVESIEKTAETLEQQGAEIAVPIRRDLSSYPKYQQHSDQFASLLFEELTGVNIDVFFGPKTWRTPLTKYFKDYDTKYGDQWEGLFVPLIDMAHDGKKIISVPIDYEHNKQQTQLEEHNLDFYLKRIEQLSKLGKAFVNRRNDLENS